MCLVFLVAYTFLINWMSVEEMIFGVVQISRDQSIELMWLLELLVFRNRASLQFADQS